MLDDAQFIQNLDRSNALGVIAGQPGQLKQKFDLQTPKFEKIDNVVVGGMGGSALQAEFPFSFLRDRLPVPFAIVRDYALPKFVGPGTLYVASSYSGNTEEALSALEQAEKAGATIVVMTAGGKLLEIAKDKNYPLLQIPDGIQPRLTVLYGAKALVVLLEAVGLVTGAATELEAAADWVLGHLGAWTADSPQGSNQAKQIASDIHGKAAVIYGGPMLELPARKWKIDLNENAKNAAFFYFLPEFSHNEFQGWLHAPKEALAVVELQSSLDHPQINKRFEVTNRLLSGKLPKPIIVQAKGETKLQQMLWTLLLGDFVSAYLAFLNGIDPTPVDLIEKLKKELA